MTGRDALKALAEGEKVRAEVARSSCGVRGYVDAATQTVAQVLARHDWEVVEPPATDEELIAEMEHLAGFYIEQSRIQSAAYAHCARMLRERKVKP